MEVCNAHAPPGGATGTDEEGNTVILALERRSVQPYATQDEYLYAMKEDLAEWFNALYASQMVEENFFEHLETGVLLCKHANTVQDFIMEVHANNPQFSTHAGIAVRPDFPEKGVQYRSNAKPETFQSRDNLSNFIRWCRGMGIPDCLLFESDDLVMRKNERNVVLCLLEVARRGARYGMLAPTIVQMEQEIEAEERGEEPPPAPKRTKPRITVDMMSLDEMVRLILGRCTCPDQFPMVRVAEGKYKIGDTQTLIFVRILRNHVMVRIGGGWDTLENYLNRHDPCRCHTRGHKSPRKTSAHAAPQSSYAQGSPQSHRQSPRPASPALSTGHSPAQQAARRRSNTPTSAHNAAHKSRVATHDLAAVDETTNRNVGGRTTPVQGSRPTTPVRRYSITTLPKYSRENSPERETPPPHQDSSPSSGQRISHVTGFSGARKLPQAPGGGTSPCASPRRSADGPVGVLPGSGGSRPSSPAVGRALPTPGAPRRRISDLSRSDGLIVAKSRSLRAQSPGRRSQSPGPRAPSPGPRSQSPGPRSQSPGPKRQCPSTPRSQRRPASAQPIRPSLTSTERTLPQPPRPASAAQGPIDPQSRSRSRNPDARGHHVRSSSVDASAMRRQLFRTPNDTSSDADVLFVSRNKFGGHSVTLGSGKTQSDSPAESPPDATMATQLIQNGSAAGKPRLANKLSNQLLLPDKHKTILRSQSQDSSSPGSPQEVPWPKQQQQQNGISGSASSRRSSASSTGPPSPATGAFTPSFDLFPEQTPAAAAAAAAASPLQTVPRAAAIARSHSVDTPVAGDPGGPGPDARQKKGERPRRASVSGTFSVAQDYGEAPPEDEALNHQMELLFEEYRRIEQGLFKATKQLEEDFRDDDATSGRGGAKGSRPASSRNPGGTRAGSTTTHRRPSSATPRRSDFSVNGRPEERRTGTGSGAVGSEDSQPPSRRTSTSSVSSLDSVALQTPGRGPAPACRSLGTSASSIRSESGSSARGRTPTPDVSSSRMRPVTPTGTLERRQRPSTPTGAADRALRSATPSRVTDQRQRPATPTGRQRPGTPTRALTGAPRQQPATPELARRVVTAAVTPHRPTPVPVRRPASACARPCSPSLTQRASPRVAPTPRRAVTPSGKMMSQLAASDAGSVTMVTCDGTWRRDPAAATGASVRRSASMGPGALLRAGSGPDSAAARRMRTGSNEDLLDDQPRDRRGRSETTRKRDATNGQKAADSARGQQNHVTQPRSSSVTTHNRRKLPSDVVTLPIDVDTYTGDNKVGAIRPGDLDLQLKLETLKAKVRKDEKDGRTRIPMPVDVKRRLEEAADGSSMKRFDSGVEINNISPTESSIQGDDDNCAAWQPQAEAISMTSNGLHYTMTSQFPDDEYY